MIHVDVKRIARKRVVRLRPNKAKLADKRALRSIINQMVATVFQHTPALIEAVKRGAKPKSKVTGMDGERPVVMLVDSYDGIDHLLSLIVTQSQHVMTRLQIELRGWSSKVEQRQRAQFVESLFAATKVNMATVLSPATVDKTVEHYLTWSTS